MSYTVASRELVRQVPAHGDELPSQIFRASPNTQNKKGAIKSQRLYTRITPQEKSKIEQLAVKCGLSQSEYLRKRALGYAPKEVPPGAFFDFCGKLDELCNLCADKITAETEERLLTLADDIYHTFLQTEEESISAIKQSTKGGDN